MTETLIRTAARRPLSALARPSVVAAFALLIAYGGGLWLNILHTAEGGYERNEPPFALHWLRDATLALPLVLVAVWAGVLLARRLIERSGCTSRATSAATLAACVALTSAVVASLGGPAHAAVFGATHGGHELSLPLHLVRDGLLGLVIDLPLAAALAFAMRASDPWAAPRVNHWLRPVSLGQAWLVKGAIGFVLLAPTSIFLQTAGTDLATADAAPAPCAPSSPVKHFDVSAIDVDIPLNRFGDHDPQGKMYVLDSKIDDVRAEERSRHVTRGLRNDAIQPLIIRANQGDCVEIRFTNQASGGEFGLHIDGLAFDLASSGDAIGNNPSSAVSRGESRVYKFWVPREPETEGAHYMRPGPGYRQTVSHGLFGALVAEPPGSKYLNMDTGEEQRSGWEATIVPGNGKKAFREYTQLYHEVGDEDFRIKNKQGGDLPTVDPHTTGYRPGSRAINYRSEPFMNRLDRYPEGDGDGYSSYPFGDPPTPMPRSYKGDPTKMRIVHAGTEMFHIFHMHGGGIRWRYNPQADSTFDYQDTGLNKHPKALSASARLDSQSIGPGESYNLEIEGGAGGVQQGAGEFLFHCHISEHYVGGGMWGFWRVYDTNQPDLEPLPDRASLPDPVDSTQLIGKTMPDGTTLTAENIDAWIRPQLPPQGIPHDNEDAQVWNWQIDQTGNGPLYLGEPEDKENWPGNAQGDGIHELPGHPGLFPVDRPVGPQDRPKILFNPTNGRPAFPLLRLHVGKRNPYAPNGHTGAPWLGETADQPKTTSGPDPWANRKDGICPASSPVRRFNVVGLELPIKVTAAATDPFGKIWVLAKDVEDIKAGRKPAEPLAIRANIGDCVAVTMVSEMTDPGAASGRSMISMHIHHVQFDTQSSDGPVTGESFEQSVRPFQTEDPTLAQPATVGQRTLRVSSAASFHAGSWIAIGMGLETIEVRQIDGIDTANATLSLDRPLNHDHAAGEFAGTNFIQSRWYPDVNLDNIFWHDHVDGIHTWGHGLVGQLVIEPKRSTYHDPRTGAQVDSGTYVDVHTDQAVAPGQVDGSFRELALWTIDTNPVTDSTLNLRASPWSDRLGAGGDPSTLFSSWTHGDPVTPVPTAYRGDPFIIRTINVGDAEDTFHVDGHRFRWDPRYADAGGKAAGTPIDTLHYGISERYSAILEGGAGGVSQRAGDYLFMNGIQRRFRQGAWGILRVLPRQVPGLQPLPGTNVPAGGSLPQQTGSRPPAAGGPGDPCPADAGQRNFDVTAVSIGGGGGSKVAKTVFVPSADANAVGTGKQQAEPLVLHVAAGECVNVRFTNDLGAGRSSFHVAKLDSDIASSGVNVGFNPEQTVADGQSRTYRYYADSAQLGSATISDLGGNDTGKTGLYGAVVVAPRGATFADPETGAAKDVGTQVDVRVPGAESYRDFTTLLADTEEQIGANFMPYPTAVKDPVAINYLSPGVRNDDATMFSSRAHGDPAKGLILRAYGGDPVRVHAIGAPGSEQVHDFNLGGQPFAIDPHIARSEEYSTRAVGPWESLDVELEGGAGGRARSVGDFYYGDVRRPFTEAGLWGLMRVMSDPSCPIKPLPGLSCTAQPSLIGDLSNLVVPGDDTGSPKSGGEKSSGGPGRRRPAPSVLNLSIRGRMSLVAVRRNGIKLRATVPSTTRRVRVRMYRLVGKKAKRVRAGEYVKAYKKIAKSGRVTVVWKSRTTRRLKAGAYLIQVAAGPRRGKYFPGGAEVRVRLIDNRRR